MRFTVELEGFLRSFRLQTDGSWKEGGEGLEQTDVICHSVDEVLALSTLKGELKIGDETFEVEPDGKPHDMSHLRYSCSVYRKDFPKVPSRDQLKEVIRNGDDALGNVLILNIDGEFELLPTHSYDFQRLNPRCVVRHESFNAGNDYVGVRASEDDSHIDLHYSSSLEHWVTHLRTGATHAYCDETATMSVEHLLMKIEKIRAAWVPQYS